MTWRTRFLGVALGAMSGALMAQQATSSPSTATTSGAQIVTGAVVQYSPGQSIVLRSADGKTATYAIGPSVSAPADVEIGRVVTLTTQSAAGSAPPVVTGIMVKESNPADTSAPSAWSGSASGATGQFSSSDVTSPGPMSGSSGPASPSASSGQSATSGQSTSSGTSSTSGASGQYSSGQSSTQSGSAGQSTGSGQSSDVPPSSGLSSGTTSSRQTTTRTETSTSAAAITGKVTAYQPKQSITVEQPGKGTVTYTIDANSTLPQDVAVGKTVTITTTTVEGSSKPVVKTVTTTTRTMKMTTESHPQ